MKVLRRKDLNLEPIVPWFFVDPNDGFRYSEKYKSKQALLEHIARYRGMNNLAPIEFTDVIVEDFICKQPGMEYYSEEYEVSEEGRRSLAGYVSGAQAFIKTISREFSRSESLASPDEAESRALSCLSCPYNGESVGKSFTERTTDGWMLALTSDKSTRYDSALKDCQRCGCPLKAKVWISRDVLDATTSESVDLKLKQPILSKNNKVFLCWARKNGDTLG